TNERGEADTKPNRGETPGGRSHGGPRGKQRQTGEGGGRDGIRTILVKQNAVTGIEQEHSSCRDGRTAAKVSGCASPGRDRGREEHSEQGLSEPGAPQLERRPNGERCEGRPQERPDRHRRLPVAELQVIHDVGLKIASRSDGYGNALERVDDESTHEQRRCCGRGADRSLQPLQKRPHPTTLSQEK